MDNMRENVDSWMNKRVDQILDGEIVNISDTSYYNLYVKTSGKYGEFDLRFGSKNFVQDGYQILKSDEIISIGERLVKLGNILKNSKKFRDGEKCFSVARNGVILEHIFDERNYAMMAWLYMGNLFKTRGEAVSHRDEIVAKYKKLKEEWVYNG